ncbi:MAG: hypothetical protein ACLT9P_03980 [Evtepia gabavorous]
MESKRSDKSFPHDLHPALPVCGRRAQRGLPHILSADVHHPELTVHVEVRDYAAYVHANPSPGAGGPARGRRRPGRAPCFPEASTALWPPG